MRISTIGSIFLLAVLASGCNVLMPKTENARQKSVFPSTLDAKRVFDAISTDTGKEATSETQLRGKAFNLGAPHSAERTVGPSRIAAVLTDNTGDGALEMLDPEIKACIALPNASDICKMTVFSDTYDRKRGVGQNVLARALGIYERTETVSWSWHMFIVLQHDGKEWRVIHKQFESSEDPPRITKRWFRSLDNFSPDIKL